MSRRNGSVDEVEVDKVGQHFVFFHSKQPY